jgi:hypothetical protein
MMNAPLELQRIYESGLRFSLEIDGEAGFIVKVGDYVQRFAQKMTAATFDDALVGLSALVLTCSPSPSVWPS